MMFKKSLRMRLSLIVVILIVTISIVSLVLSNLFLYRYYLYSKRESLIEVFNSLDEIYLDNIESGYNDSEDETDNSLSGEINQTFGLTTPDGSDSAGNDNSTVQSQVNLLDSTLSEDLLLKMDQMSNNKNLAVIVYRDLGSSIFNLFGQNNTKLLLYSTLGNNQSDNVESSNVYSDYLKGEDAKGFNVDTTTDRYSIEQLYVKRLGSNYIYLNGTFRNGDHVLIRSSVAGMNESVLWSNRFYLYISVIVSLIGLVIMYIVCGRFLKPIGDLNTIAGKMSNLDFSVKYEGKAEDEVGELGKSINVLSENLESTLVELKKANAQLRQDLQQKEEIDAMRKEFLSNVSHELKTPIALIQGYAEGLLDNISDDEESRNFYCEVIMDESKKMNNMVKKIIALNQLEFGYGNVSMEHFDIIDMIRAVIQKSDILIKQHEADIRFDSEQKLLVWSDAYMAEEVFTNYFTNALNHLNYDKIIKITAEKNDNTVRISVFNTGDPIPEDDIDKIWDKFYKVDKARTREYGGSGVGLSIVKASMDLLGQKYGVRNEENGVTFWFDLDCSNAS